MPKPQPVDFTACKRALKAAGVRFTDQRAALWRFLYGRGDGATIGQMSESLKHRGIGLTTVYRTIDLFQRLDLVNQIHSEQGEHRYIIKEPGHTHPVVCTDCGQVRDIDICLVGQLKEEIEKRLGYVVTSHSLELYGVCPGCREQSP